MSEMEEHNQGHMLELVMRLAVHFQRAWENKEQLAMLAMDWAEDLSCYPWPVVERAAKLCRTTPGRRNFPTTGEMIEVCELALAEWRRQQNRLALPEQVERPLTEQEMRGQLERLKEYRARFAGVVDGKRMPEWVKNGAPESAGAY